ncbi:MAG: hypothetical protein A3D24_02505 [Candidatus Blackburnbacteria bacterium RIFCSPHIGHO2_02_FULL_39_13]|uniref:Glycosyltransferase RgtA/B/C/D-like domain-containing protein n=1 Tax=Candidatus Blackburnbacteria bacterium RIFCSPLOWO2_01_FULL_40_20 TaxID=1797519 RepID=A0A1G1VCE6_9BACT|nr:MAG: hypothetical protein UT38_C0013G0013 [Microgenomates group bacterium GW2011_GWA2_39_19]OGY06893.1 MAG: hypothetical protein A2694_03295 [Candidatus Blackburnbacteria bacterium RIFCSPHIGHO2_01_FULL_40_17]OGY08374.1 MAG: hypothetical protein A3D24_02505 [Candidatus Blackburnbacteria bacterium RIFCSPHIGHO2_02_FULL_39_13]OGY13118.1 MAG: hypothetical protein A3A77_03970 [Candidatus Blackburnbacteria bacterium RIFCSPLOWO2_01_FULL_40_20]
MRRIFPFKYLQENWLLVSLITITAIIVWFKILNIVPSDYAYFGPLDVSDINYFSINSILSNAGFFSQLIYFALVPLFRDRIALYMAFQLIVMIMVFQTYYLVIVKITKDKYLSFLATVFFMANYVGTFTMFGTGNNQRFVQRIPNLPLIFVSFYYLTNYLESNKKIKLLLSYILFIASVVLAHFSILFLPIFAVYPFVYFLLNRPKSVTFKSILLIPLFFAMISILLTRGDSLTRPNESPLSFIKETPIQAVLYQISSVSFPQQLTVYISKHLSPPIPYPYLQTQNFVLVVIAIIFLVALLRGGKHIRSLPLYVTFLLSLPILSFFVIYAYNLDPNPIKFFDEDRIYFFHTILIAFIWAACIKFFFGKNKTAYALVSILIAGIFLFENISLIWKGIDRYQYRSNMYRAFIGFTKTHSLSFSDKTVVISPPDMIRTTDPFIRRFYNLDRATFIALEDGWVKQVADTKADKKDVYVLDYRYGYNANNDIDPHSVQIIDKSEDFRTGKDINQFVKP